MFINKRKYIFVGLAKIVAKENKKAKKRKMEEMDVMPKEEEKNDEKRRLHKNEGAWAECYTYRSGRPTKRQNKVEPNRWTKKKRSKP
jgi:hypothetical protein